jgi:hypothetical protein
MVRRRIMSGRAVVDLLGPASNIWIDAGGTRTLILGDPILGPDNEVSLMMYVDVIALPEALAGADLSVTTHVRVFRVGDRRVRNVQYVVQNHNTLSGVFFTRIAILARFAAQP